MKRFTTWFAAVGAMLFLLASVPGFSQQNPERLVLKDGSYQNVTKWEIQGDRVRYYSAERYSWEELPRELVDWPATEKYNKERGSIREKEVEEAARETAAAEPEPPTAAPGLYLPDGGGVFLLDNFNKEPQLVELNQNSGELNKHVGKNILRAAINPLALSSKQTIELKGLRAQTQAHTTQPTFYIDVDTGNSDAKAASSPSPTPAPTPAPALGSAPSLGPGSRGATAPPAASNTAPPTPNAKAESEHFRIVRLEKKKDSRVLGNVNVAIYGKVSQKENFIKTVAQPAGGDWVKITPAEPLTPGEYAVVELLEKGQVNLYVWDFGVNPTAPPNAHAWSAKKSVTGQAEDKPELNKRPR